MTGRSWRSWPVALSLLAGSAWAQAPWQTVLPPTEPVLRWLADNPQVQAANAGIELAKAQSRRLQVGPHEWTLKAGFQRRSSDGTPERLREQEWALERAVRWPHKVAQDEKLGHLLQSESEAAREDARHEAARSLLADWFEQLKARASAQRQSAQLALAEQQLVGVRLRVKAGEVAPLDALAAQADQARAQALASQAHSRWQVLQRQWQGRYPGLAAPLAVPLPDPVAPEGDAARWAQSILRHNHELEWAQLRAETAQAQAERQQQERWADPLLGVRSANERSGTERVLGVYVSLPLGGAARQAQAAAAQAEAEQARQRLTLIERELRAQATEVASAAFDQHATWQQLHHASEQTRRSADLQWRAYTLGEASLADVLQARRLAQEDAQAAENARMDALHSHARLVLDAHQLWASE